MFSGGEKISNSSYRDQAAANNLSKTRPYQGLLQAKSPLPIIQQVQSGDNLLQAKGNDVPENRTGMPDGLKTSMETMSGFDLSDVKVHYNSSHPAQLNALAYAQGSDIHIGPGQEQHLPHEAWHVVQQRQGRVQPTMQLRESIPVNDDPGLEKEADMMGQKAVQAMTASHD
ncbi:DUF4157 domain-containing protein [Flavitalea sp. BT771]|uniref:eCIS core domain-containing protein n=1 Tax=Flavitalea sp. BT771 TaxID=3063329 RepID=UPI0026E2C910|nr:DUF4157 domain-containing protein [Flavitalea sp. BT771]MDO6432087.1 DUF4157 domain-containing protein [Flavitalea sp. BT771]MDV6220996.1 DUF4157 domain-containing protein [Flavitalea sp. BT771]